MKEQQIENFSETTPSSDFDDEWFEQVLKEAKTAWKHDSPQKLEELEALGVSTTLVSHNTYLCNIDEEWFYYYPGSGKWRAKGSARIYNSGGAESFVTIVREYRKTNSNFKQGTENLLTLQWNRVYVVKELIALKRKAFSKYIVVLDEGSRCWSNCSFERQIEKPGTQFLTAPCCALNTKKEYCSVLIVESKKKKTKKQTKERKTKK